MSKRGIVFIITIVGFISILTLTVFYNSQKPQLGELGYPSKEEMIRFYKKNKDSLEYIQQTTSVIDNSFVIRSNNDSGWNYEGKDKEDYSKSEEQKLYDKNFKEGSKLLKISKKLFNSKWISIITKRTIWDNEGNNTYQIRFYNTYTTKTKEEYQVGIIYFEEIIEKRMKTFQLGQIYKDNHIEGNWYYFCQYKPTTKETWRP
ncbi:hypothetical protein QTL86_02895 [Cellulosilyticum sp. ST5]|uniref:hypothetical protein n=1 Tax=unclassified Cellulosilyticum TaxID=2643091 RepID=UPI000F8DDD64|nr:hypothetical protein [Cellulosilyticum sp. WCF-2]QEH70052.1 hypothetical protein EKH84_17305 [Cellulosilyticum sp. WCF-2]